MESDRKVSAKIIFLDFDGVLNCNSYICAVENHTQDIAIVDEGNHLDPERVSLVNFIVKETGAQVVISSSWRKLYTVEKLDAMLKLRGATFDVVGKTPNLRTKNHLEQRRIYRGEEIQSYIDALKEKPSSIVIIDDDTDMVHLTKYLVRTAYFGRGLTLTHAHECCKMLNETTYS